MATTSRPALVVDTCAAIWIVEGARLTSEARTALARAYRDDRPVLVSSITAWEFGLLVARNRYRPVATPEVWFRTLVELPGFAETTLTSETLIAASFLPGKPPNDPADRIILATARQFGVPVLTRDRLVLGYAAQGHVAAVEC
ncbi:MAG: type II toxin-antitoxin system VapC family toxin [Bauldia sp.]